MNNLSLLLIQHIVSYIDTPLDAICFILCCKKYYEKRAYIIRHSLQLSDQMLQRNRYLISLKGYIEFIKNDKHRFFNLDIKDAIIDSFNDQISSLKFLKDNELYLKIEGYNQDREPILIIDNFVNTYSVHDDNQIITIKAKDISPSIRRIRLKYNHERGEDVVDLSFIPSTVQELNIQFENEIVVGSIPPTIRIITLGPIYKHPLIRPLSDTQQLFPRDLTTLVLGRNVIEPGAIPQGVKRIWFISLLADELTVDSLPSGLETLGFGIPSKQQQFKEGVLPDSLKSMSGAYHMQKYPPNLESLQIEKPIAQLPLPSSLLYLDLSRCQDEVDITPCINLRNLHLFDLIDSHLIPKSVTHLTIKSKLKGDKNIPDHIQHLILSEFESDIREDYFPATLNSLTILQNNWSSYSNSPKFPTETELILFGIMDNYSNGLKYLTRNRRSFTLLWGQLRDKRIQFRFIDNIMDDRLIFMVNDYQVGGIAKMSDLTGPRAGGPPRIDYYFRHLFEKFKKELQVFF